MKKQFQSKSVPRGTRTIWRYLGALFILFTFAIGNVWGALTAHTPGTYEKTIDKGGYGATIVTVAERDYEVYGFSYNSSGSKPQILWAGTSTNNASASQVLCSTLSAEVQEIAGWISMSTAGKSSTYSMPSSTEFAASSVGSTGLYQMKLQGHSFTIKVKGYDQFSFLGNDNNGTQSKGKYLQVTINGSDVTKDLNSSTTVRRYDLNPSIESTIVITGLNTSNEHIDAFSLRLPSCDAPTTAFSEGAYTVGESALALSSLIVENSNNSDGAITYSVKTDGGTGASIAAGSFTATTAGTATITATQAADATHNKCEKIIDFNVVVTASSCAATIPGDISKGALTAGEITLTADGSAESGDIWYWQDAADGTATNLGTGATKNINTAGMYYIRSYNTAGECWSAAKSIEVTAEELLEHYAITYNKGAYGTGEIAGGEKVEGVDYTLSSERFTRVGYVQTGWSLTDGGTKAYDLGGSYTTDEAKEFFPVWAETSTYVASFDSGEGCSASTPAGWTFSNAGYDADNKATVDYVCNFVAAGMNTPKQTETGDKTTDDDVAFAKNTNAIATYDLGAATTVTAMNVTLCGGSGNPFDETIEYLGSDGTTVKKSYVTSLSAGNWKDNAINKSEVVEDVRYIRVHGASKWVVMKAFSVTYVDLVTKYNVTFDKNGGSGADMATLKYAEGAEVTLPGCTFTAPDNKEFDAWTSTDVTISNNKFTMPNKPVTIKATWKTLIAKYDVEYYDGDTKIGTESQVRADQHPTAAGINTTKPLYTFVGWYLSSTLEGDPVALNTVTPVEGLKLYGKWAKAYATSVDLKAAATGSDEYTDVLDAHNIAYELTNTSWDDGTDIYNGLKIKGVNSYIKFNLKKGQLLILTVGYATNDVKIEVNDVDQSFVSSTTALSYFNYYAETADVVITVTKTANQGTASSIRSITIRDPYEVSFNVNGGDAPIAAQFATPSVTLPSASKGTDSFVGWFDDETKIGEAGESYTPTANITLVAHWEAVSTDARLSAITFSSDAGTLSPAFDPEVVNYTYTMPYGTAAIPTITGATSVSAKAQEPVIVQQAAAWNEMAIIRGKAQSGDTKAYNVTMKMAPKDGVCLVWGDITADNTITYNATNSKFYAESDVTLETDVNGKDSGAPSGKKFQGGDHIQIGLNEGTFLAGDVVALDVTYGTANKMYVFKAQAATAEDVIGELDGTTTPAGVNKVAITENAANLWLVRGGIADSWNPHVDYVAVYRIMNPLLKAITINGEAGTINESLKTVAVELQPGYDLDALSINTTIVSNTAEADVVKTVTSNGGNWIIGDNTYRLTDKDGDYTEYTVTLTAGELKHNVSFNTHGGSIIDPVQVVDGQKLAAAPADPTKDDYLFQGWAETEDGSIVDVTSFTISADKEFHAVWASDGAIKLLDGATVNHTNYITSVTADETVEFKGNVVNYAKFSGTVSGVNGVKDLTRVIAYNATTNKTKIQISAHNNSTSGRNILVKGLVEGADAAVDLATIALGNKEDKVSDWIEFDNAANRTIYIMVSSSAGDVYFTQVKVIESGENAMKQAGEAGYALNLNKGRFFGLASTDLAFEGLNARLTGDYTALSSDYAKLKATSMSFTVASAMTLSVTANNSKTYYVTKDAAGTDNATEKSGVSEFDLTAGTWYITAGSSEVQFTNIAFTAPKCEQPTVVDMENIGLCEGDAFTALTVSASVTDGGTLHYQWYKHPAEGDDEAVGTDAASYTPTADGQYYVVVTNKLADHSDNSKASNTVTVEHFASAVITTAPLNQRGEVGDVVTLSAAATGKNVAYKWYTCDEDGSNEVALDPAQTGTSINVTITAGLLQWYKVKVTSDCGGAEAKAKVSEFVPTTPANVTTSILWDWTSSAWPASGEVQFTNKTVDGTDLTPAYELLADADAIVPNNAAFRSDMLYGKGQYVWRSNNKFFQGTAIKFNTTVAGKVRVNFRSTGSGKTVAVAINGIEAGSRSNSFGWSEYVEVPAGGVEIICLSTDAEKSLTRVQKIEFLALAHQRTSGYNAGDLGTVCLEDATFIEGANLYELAGLNENGYLAFDEVLSGELEAGKPYLFEVTNPSQISFYKPIGAAHTDTESSTNGMIGTFSGTTLTQGANNYYYFSGRHIWKVNDFTVDIPIPDHRCYVDYDVLLAAPAPLAPAPGRRRITMGVQGTQVATGCENLNVSDKPVKMIINGQLFILRGEKMYDAKGQLVK